jgi:hypothetical protein
MTGPMIYGYARVSADGQSLEAQVKRLRAAWAKRIFKETASGAKSDQAELAKLLNQGPQCHRALLLPAQGFSAHRYALRQTRQKLFFQRLSRRRRSLLAVT